MGIFEKIKDATNQAKEAATQFAEEKGISDKVGEVTGSIKKTFDEKKASMKARNDEAKELKKPLDGAIARYEFTYVGGLDDIAKPKAGAWGMNVMQDRFAFRVTITTKDWLYDLDIPYSDITDIRIEKRTISNAEIWLGAGNDPNQQQENVVVIEYDDSNNRKATLRIEMLTGTSIFNQAAKCKELFDLLRKEEILPKIKKNDTVSSQGNTAIDQIKKLSELRDAGILSEDEFNAKKAELLSQI